MLYAPEEHEFLSRLWFSGLREVATLRGTKSRATHLRDLLLGEREEFRRLWSVHKVGLRPHTVKHLVHPEVGELELNCQSLLEPNQSLSLLVYTAEPGSESAEKLQLLSIIGASAESTREPFPQ